MRIFVLEDDPSRIHWFEQRFIGHDVTYADSCLQIERFQPPYDLICLDHDLGGRQMSKHEDNGERFAVLIREQHGRLQRPETVVVVHSFNPEGAARIVREMAETGYSCTVAAPFRFRPFEVIVDTFLA